MDEKTENNETLKDRLSSYATKVNWQKKLRLNLLDEEPEVVPHKDFSSKNGSRVIDLLRGQS